MECKYNKAASRNPPLRGKAKSLTEFMTESHFERINVTEHNNKLYSNLSLFLTNLCQMEGTGNGGGGGAGADWCCISSYWSISGRNLGPKEVCASGSGA